MGLPNSWQWRAKRILAWLTCYDPVTGLLGFTTAKVTTNEALRLNAASVRLYSTGSGIIYSMELPEIIAETLRAMTEMPVVEGSPDNFRLFCLSELSDIVTRLTFYRPDLDWDGDPSGAAITVISEMINGDAEAQRIWTHYREIFTPAMPTPDCPLELLIRTPGQETRANIARCQQIFEVPDDLGNQIRRAELAYRVVVYSECVAAIPEAV